MESRTLTDTFIQHLRPPPAVEGKTSRDDYWDRRVPGLAIRISSSGSRTWILRVRALRGGAWVKIRINLGRYPAMGLQRARARAEELRAAAEEGKDPAQVIEREKSQMVDKSRNTLRVVAGDFLDLYARLECRPATVKQYQHALLGAPASPWISRPVADITRREVIHRLERIRKDSGLPMANRVRAYWSKFFKWCRARDVIPHSPVEGVEPLGREKSRDRVLTVYEIREIWAALGKMGGPWTDMVRVALLTGQRVGEIIRTSWAELQLSGERPLWALPANRAKNGLPHLVPLSPQVVEILRGIHRKAGCPWVFTTDATVPIGGWSKPKRELDETVGALRQHSEAREPMPHWVIHDLRRTVSTGMHELGVEPHIVEAVLNHISGHKAGVAGTYNKAQYLEEKRRALTLWADHIDQVLTGESRSNIVPFRGR